MAGSGHERKGSQALEEVLFPTDEPIAVKVAKKFANVLKNVMQFSGPSMAELHENIEQPEPPSGADLYFEDSNADERLRGLSMEQAMVKAKSLMVEDGVKQVAKTVQGAMSLGEVEMSEIYGSTSAGTSTVSGSEIEVDFSTPSSSNGAVPGSSIASNPCDVV